MKNQILALIIPVILPASVLADTQPCPIFDGGVAQTVEMGGANVTLFAAGFYERPEDPPETRGAKWIPGRKRNLCSVSTFSALGSGEGEGGDEGGDGSGGNEAEDGNGDKSNGKSESERLAEVNDCIPLHDWASSHPGHWVIPQRNLLSSPLLALGSCAITASVRREWRGRLPWGVAVSSEDVRRVVREVLEKYRVDSRAGGQGDMGCLGWGRWEPLAAPVDWRVGGWEGEE